MDYDSAPYERGIEFRRRIVERAKTPHNNSHCSVVGIDFSQRRFQSPIPLPNPSFAIANATFVKHEGAASVLRLSISSRPIGNVDVGERTVQTVHHRVIIAGSERLDLLPKSSAP